MESNVSASVERKTRQTTITDFFKPVSKEENVLDDSEDEEEYDSDEEMKEEHDNDEEMEEEDHSDICSCSSCGWEAAAADERIPDGETYEDMLTYWADCERRRWDRARQWTLIEIYGWDRARKVDPEAFSALFYRRAFGYSYQQAQWAEERARA